APEVGAECPNWARSVLCGGRSAMSVPTAIRGERRKENSPESTPVLRQYPKKRVSEISYGDEFAVFSWRFVSYMSRQAVSLYELGFSRGTRCLGVVMAYLVACQILLTGIATAYQSP